MGLKPGDKAPLFKLFSSDKEEISLEDYSGKNVVLLFFPMAFTSVCTEELCTMRDNLSTYENLNAAILGISVNSVFTLDKFKSEQQLNFPLLSDYNKEMSRNYGVLIEDFVFNMKGVSKRAVFVIDKEGVITYSEILKSPGDLPNFITLKEAVEALN